MTPPSPPHLVSQESKGFSSALVAAVAGTGSLLAAMIALGLLRRRRQRLAVRQRVPTIVALAKSYDVFLSCTAPHSNPQSPCHTQKSPAKNSPQSSCASHRSGCFGLGARLHKKLFAKQGCTINLASTRKGHAGVQLITCSQLLVYLYTRVTKCIDWWTR